MSHEPSYENRPGAHCLVCREEVWPCKVALEVVSGHKRIVCSCGALIAQCRCPGPHETEVRQDACPECQKKLDR